MLTTRGSSKVLLVLLSCAAASACSDEERPPPAPTAVAASPENGRATVSWSSPAGATSFKVYYALSPQVTTSDPSVTVSAPPAVVPSLANGTPYYFAVSTVNDVGASPLSAVACAVPTPADTTGLTLYDPLCGAVLDGARWGSPGHYTIGVSSGAAELSVSATNQAPRPVRGVNYTVNAVVRTAPGQRVTTLRSGLRVPSATASRAGSADIRGMIRLLYQPPAHRFEWPDSQQHVLVLEVGLVDAGAGLKAFRSVAHCDAIRCPERSATGVAFTDPPELSVVDSTGAGAAAAFDTTYTVTASLDEATGVFHWTIAGGAFGTGISGSADPSAYLAATPAWSGVPLAGAGFWRGELAVRTFDPSQQGGGSGAIAARFDDVHVGLNGGAAALHDDFGGASGMSGPEELSVARWGAASDSVRPSGGRLAIRSRVTSAGAFASVSDRLNLANPESIAALQADVAIDPTLEGDGTSAHVGVQGTFYNDGSAGNAPASPLGDVFGSVFLYPATNQAMYVVGRCANATCSGALSPFLSGTFSGVTVGAARHTVLVRFDPASKRFTFRLDGQTVEVDATTVAPVAGPANAPLKRVFGLASVPSVAGSRARSLVTVNNVFVAP